MKIEIITDLSEIRRLAKKNEEENWGFRSFLKSGVIPSNQIDKMAQSLYKKIIARIDCKKCGNCCKSQDWHVTETDIAKLSKRLDMKPAEVKEKYLRPDEENEGMYFFKEHPCPFLKGTMCLVYSARPSDCSSYPHVNKKSLISRSISMINGCSVCPIIFNLYEALKAEIWSMDDEMDDDELDQMVEDDFA